MTRGNSFQRRREDVRNCRKPYANVEFAYLEGEMAQTQRNNAIDKLKNGVVTALARTDAMKKARN